MPKIDSLTLSEMKHSIYKQRKVVKECIRKLKQFDYEMQEWEDKLEYALSNMDTKNGK